MQDDVIELRRPERDPEGKTGVSVRAPGELEGQQMCPYRGPQKCLIFFSSHTRPHSHSGIRAATPDRAGPSGLSIAHTRIKNYTRLDVAQEDS